MVERAQSIEFGNSLTIPTEDHFVQGLYKPPGSRTEQELSAMVDELAVNSTQKNSFLGRFEASGQLAEFCKGIQLRRYESGQTLFEQGDKGDSFGIVFKGAVSVYVNSQPDSAGVVQPVKMAELRKGQFFGEMSLTYSLPRNSTLITIEQTELICLDKEPYDTVVKSMQEQQIALAHKVIARTPLFESIGYDVVDQLARQCYLKKFSPGQVIEVQNTQPQGLYVIQKGLVNLTRVIDFRSAVAGTVGRLARGPGEEEAKSAREVKIDQLHDGSVFCDYALLYSQPLQYSAVCVKLSYIYFIEAKYVPTAKSVCCT
jgi:cAMP-dependent protein kinase regulator